jgi:predicted P-loop ATPase
VLQRFGATPEAWDHFADTLGLAPDLLPVVSNPSAEISPLSKMRALGKTPSMYNRDRLAVGLPNWTKFQATEHIIQRWKSEPDYGISIQTRAVRAFDIDVADPAKAQAIATAIMQITGPLPLRFRANSGKRLLGFTYNRPLTKHAVPVDGGMVEILADGQQFIAAGAHIDSKSGFEGAFYEWAGDLPKAFPVITGEQFEQVWMLLSTILATGEARVAREKRKGSADPDLIVHDGVADWLVENWETYDVGSDGQVFIECPFAAEHTSDSGPTSTAYFPAGTGGFARGHFVCLHAHCAGREDQDYLDATGYNVAQFADLTAGADMEGSTARSTEGAGKERVHGLAGGGSAQLSAAERPAEVGSATTRGALPQISEWPPMIREKSGKIESTAENLFTAIAHGGMIFRHIAHDAFTDNIVWAPIEQPKATASWRNFNDADMIAVRIELERRGFKPMGKDLLRDSIYAAAKENQIDTAIEWLSRLRWDGRPRIDTYTIDVWGWVDSPYSRAVGAYLWTAMAGRVLQPGVRADMAPILIGLQGLKKTTTVQLMAPSEDQYAEVKLTDNDDDIARKLRGKLVGELEELRGINSRAIEEIKAFVTRRHEQWVPKYKEFAASYARRCLLIGTGNEDEFLSDPTGERRWLPGQCGVINVDLLVETRDQLWAEGAARFVMNGVEWQDAERLAIPEHGRFKVTDSWERAIRMWLERPQIGDKLPEDKGYVSVHEVLEAAIGMNMAQANRAHELRVIKALRAIGFEARENGDGKVYAR